MKQAMYDPEFSRLTPEVAEQNFRHFMNTVNYELFGKAFHRHKKRISVIPSLECSPSGRFHYHALLDRPIHSDEPNFCDLIRSSWINTRWGYKQVDIRPAYDPAGWVRYMMKRNHPGDAIDWENAVLP